MAAQLRKSTTSHGNKKFSYVPEKIFIPKFQNNSKEICNFNSHFFLILKDFIRLPFAFRKIISFYIGNRTCENKNNLSGMIIFSKMIWVNKNFSSKQIILIKQKEVFQISRIINCNLTNFLNLCGSIFFTKFSNYSKNIIYDIFNLKFVEEKKVTGSLLTKYIGNYVNCIYHYFKSMLFSRITIETIDSANFWLIYKGGKPCPWWRRFRTRECELEFICKEIIKTTCTIDSRKKF